MTQTTTAERDWWLTGDATQFRPIFADVLESVSPAARRNRH